MIPNRLKLSNLNLHTCLRCGECFKRKTELKEHIKAERSLSNLDVNGKDEFKDNKENERIMEISSAKCVTLV